MPQMTKLNLGSKVQREVWTSHFGDLVVKMTSEGIYTREKGKRTWYGPVSYNHVHMAGAKLAVEEKRRERRMGRSMRKAIRL